MDEILQIPTYYVVSRQLPKEEAGPVLRALSITPVYCAIISNILDADLAFAFAPQVMRCVDEEVSHLFARQTAQNSNMPVVVVGTANVLDAVYADGRREEVASVA